MASKKKAAEQLLEREIRRARAGGTRTTAGKIVEIGVWLTKYMLRPVGAAWLAVARSIYGVRLDKDDLAALASVVRFTGRPRPDGFSEALVIAGRRSGKSSFCAALAVYECVEMGAQHMARLQVGQRGTFAICAPTVAQAIETGRYAAAITRQHFADQLEDALESQSGLEVRFTNGMVIRTMVGNASTLRGPTYVGAILEERCFFRGEDDANYSSEEIATVFAAGMLRPSGAPRRLMLSITSPGVIDTDTFHLGQANAHSGEGELLVASGPSFTWNENLDRNQLAAFEKRDHRRWLREVMGQWVHAINQLLDNDGVDRSYADRDTAPLPPRDSYTVAAGLDIGLKRDSTALVLAARQDAGDLPKTIVLGCWRWSPKPGTPLDVATVVRDVCEICARYGCSSVTADQFSFLAVAELFRQQGIELKEHAWTLPSKLARFGVLRDLLAQGRLSLPRHERLIHELRSLDEQVTASGQIRIAARGRGHDDCAFACALAVSEAATATRSWFAEWADSHDPDLDVERDYARAAAQHFFY